jgi:hypothetical protein
MSDLKIKISAQDSASKVLAEVRDSMTRVEEVSSKVGAALGLIGVAGIGGLVATVRAAVDGVDAFNDLKDATGSSIENISALDDVAQRTGTSFGTVESALIKFNTALKDAKPGSDAEAAINALGLSVKELKDLDPAEALLKTSQALNGFADDGNKARLVQELFGKSLKEVSPFLKDLAEKGELVAKVTTQQAEEAEKFNKQLFELQANSANAARSLSIGLVTAINDTIRAFKEGREAGQSFFEIANNRYWDNVAKFYGTAGDAADGYRKRLAEIDQQLSGGESGLLMRNALLREQAELQAKLAATPVGAAVDQTAAEDARLGRKRSISLPDKVTPPVSSTRVLDLTKQQDTALQSLREQLKGAAGDVSEFDKVVERLTIGTWAKFNAETKIAALSIAGEIDNAKKVVEQQKAVEAVLSKAAAAWESYIEGLRGEIDALAKGNEAQAQQIEEIGLTTDELNKLRLSRQDATIAQLEATRATAEANGLSYEEISILEQKIELLKQQREITASGQARQAAADTKQEQDRASKEYADTLKNDLKGAFSAAFRDSSGDPLKAFGDALENIMFTRAATALSEAAFESLGAYFGSGSSGSGGGIGDLLAGIFSFDGGGSTGNGSRTGGLDGKGGFMALLHPQETVLDHTKGQTGTGGSAVTVVQNINIDSRSDQATILAAMEQAKQSTLATIQQSRRAGGVYA